MKNENLKGLSLALAIAIALFMFLFGCSNQPLAIILAAAIPAVYIAFVVFVECLVEGEDYECLWFVVAYLFIIGLIMFLSQMALVILILMPVVTGIIIWVLADYLYSYDYGIELVNALAPLAQSVVIICTLLTFTEFSYKSVKDCYEEAKELLVNHEVISEEEMANIHNTYDLEELYLTKKQMADSVKEELDAIKNTIKVRDYDSVEIPETKQLYIKRLWYNSDQTPWSYDAYGRFKFNVNSTHALFSSRINIDTQMDYNGEYAGEYNIEYVNIVLSDNTFYRFNVAENYQWLVAKEGDRVTKIFKKNELNFDKLHQPIIKSELKLNF